MFAVTTRTSIETSKKKRMKAARDALCVAALAVLASQSVIGCADGEENGDDLFGGNPSATGGAPGVGEPGGAAGAPSGAAGALGTEGGGGAAGSSSACAPGQEECAGECVTLGNNPDHCGSCGNACDADQVCSGGKCRLDCVGGTTACDRSCVDTDLDPENCGACGEVCDAGLACSRGSCEASCAAGLTWCDGGEDAPARCVDTRRDRENCGECGNSCDAGYVCNAGTCSLSCPDGLVKCGDTCVDPTTSREYCGATAGCGEDGQGSAGESCDPGEVCSAGTCALSCQAGLVECSGTCIDPERNREHCGATEGCGQDGGTAGVACNPGEICIAGECVVSCPGSLIVCDDTCVNPNTDRNYCGATEGCGDGAGDAGEVCADGEICVGGTCVLSCPSSLVACGGTCVDPESNPDYCGASGNCQGPNAGAACAADQACVAGVCRDLVTVYGYCRKYAGAIWCGYDDLEAGRSCTEICEHAGLVLSDDTSVVQSIDDTAECTALFAAFGLSVATPLVYGITDFCAGISSGVHYCSSDPDCVVEAPQQPGQPGLQLLCPCE